jgi:hypothetical protein
VFRTIPTFSSIRFSISGLVLKSLIYLKLSFMQGGKYGSICILLHAVIQFDQDHLLKMLCLHCITLASLSKLSVHRCVVLYLSLQFNYIDQPICFYANTMQFLLLLLCNND